jgi:hypothetical protein
VEWLKVKALSSKLSTTKKEKKVPNILNGLLMALWSNFKPLTLGY